MRSKTLGINVRVTPKEKEKLLKNAGYCALSLSEYLRRLGPVSYTHLSKNEGQLAESYSHYQLVNPGDYAMNHMDLLTGWVDISKYTGVTLSLIHIFVTSALFESEIAVADFRELFGSNGA